MTAIERLIELDAVGRLRDRDTTLFSEDALVQAAVLDRLGWTDLAQDAGQVRRVAEQVAAQARDKGMTDVVLLGMGGSSLASLVMSSVLPCSGACLHVLDTVSPIAVGRVLEIVDPRSTIVLVSSKSGGTIEPNALYAVFRERFEQVLAEKAGDHFIAITDPGSSLERLAREASFLAVVPSPPDVGGRFSALTTFGLVPAALMGVDLGKLIEAAQAMEQACGEREPGQNPAMELAGFIADNLEAGRDKLTIVASRSFSRFGLWVEQLVAESLGKYGQGVVPVVELATGTPTGYGPDRAVVVVRENGDARLAEWAQANRGTVPVHELLAGDPYSLGAEFVRWEYAVALTGALMGVNPFDEPNVAEAKEATSAVLAGEAEQARRDLVVEAIDVTFSEALGRPQHHEHSMATVLGHVVASLEAGDYLAVLAYLPDDERVLEPLVEAVPHLASATGAAVALEIGPRYLHSTGQLHKGGPNNGVFLIVTNRADEDIDVPGQPWGLRALHRAQAEGDFATLLVHQRRAVRLDLPDASASTVAQLAESLLDAAGVVREGLSASRS